MTAEHWWNADFDLTLRRGSAGLDDTHRTQVRELAFHALTAAAGDESVLVSEEPPTEFVAHLRAKGIEVPRISPAPEILAGARFSPYGWSRAAYALNSRYDHPAPAPPLEAVARVNGRSFAHRVERERLGGDVPVGCFESIAELRALLESQPPCDGGWVAKTEHGNAALGNRRVPSRRLSERDLRWLQARLADGPMVVERWLGRILDLCAVFTVSEAGGVTDFGLHETVHTADGGFIGAVFEPGAESISRWEHDLADAVETVAAALADAGYFGPVCLDALVWDDRGTPRLRPVVDVNARRHASEGWRRLAGRWGGCVYGRFFTVRKLRLPDSYRHMDEALGSDAWDSRRRTGALVTSPLWLGEGNRRRPRKLGVVFRGRTRAEVTAMERRFRDRFER